MKKIFPILTVLLIPSLVFGAFTATDNFDSYSNGSDVVGQSGGSNWTTAWFHINAGGVGTVTTAQSQTSPNSVQQTGSASISRSFTAVSDGTIYFSAYWQGGDERMGFDDSGNANQIYLHFDSTSGNLLTNLNGPGGEMVVGPTPFTQNTWHTIGIQIDSVGHALKYEVYVDGIWYDNSGSWWDLHAGSQTINQIDLAQAFPASNSVFYDSISPTLTATSPTQNYPVFEVGRSEVQMNGEIIIP